MVEIFKTDVTEVSEANRVVACIVEQFKHLEVNFDLEDCDKILRVASRLETINEMEIIRVVNTCGYQAEVFQENI